jgi:two-component system OmpR family sensor kinase
MISSVRFRLTCWYTGILALVLAVFSITVYTVLAHDAYGDVDASLAASLDVLSRSLRHEIEEHQGKLNGEESFRGVIASVYKDSFPDVGVAVYDAARLVAAKPGAGGRVPGRPLVSFEHRTENAERIASREISIPGAGNYRFLAETSLLQVRSELSDLRDIFYLAIPAALALAALGGYLLARKSLSPVVAMSADAERISAKDLSQRVAVRNEKDELGQLATTFNRLLERIERSFEFQKRFMADSSHELQTPIYVARTATDVTLSAGHRPEAEYREALTTIQEQLRRLSHIVEGMFTLALADAGAYPVKMEDFYIDEVIAECVRAAKILGQSKRIKVFAPELTEMPFRGDEGLMRQLILALLDNAVKHTAEGGRIEVAMEIDNTDRYAIEVRDSGEGIPPEAQRHIFDRFFRGDRIGSHVAVGRRRGAGLGLAIARWIAETHKGALTLVKSGPEGSVFRTTLPRPSSGTISTGRLLL